MKPPKTIAESERRLEAAVTEWAKKADALVRSKLADAKAHASKSVTAALRETADGRPTARKAASSPSSVAAAARIEELRCSLIGSRRDALDGLIRDARAALYRESFDWIRPYLVGGVHRMDAGPTVAGEAVARGAVIHGYDLAAEFDGGFRTAGRTLAACVNLAGGRFASPKAADLLLDAWEEKQRRAISGRCKLALGDSARALLWAVEQALATR